MKSPFHRGDDPDKSAVPTSRTSSATSKKSSLRICKCRSKIARIAANPPQQAAQSARREFGNVALVEHVTRDQWRGRRLDEFLQDLRFAVRTLRKSPGFTAIAILHARARHRRQHRALFCGQRRASQSAAYPQPEQLVTVCNGTASSLETWLSYPDAVDLMRDNHSFSSFAAYESLISANLLGQGEPERVSVTEVSSRFLPTLGTTPVLGRNLRRPKIN